VKRNMFEQLSRIQNGLVGFFICVISTSCMLNCSGCTANRLTDKKVAEIEYGR